MRHMKAALAYHDKQVLPDGSIVELKIWHLAEPVTGSKHQLKYSLFYGVPGKRLVGYDNERGKGDHRHFSDRQERYEFRDVDKLVSDFLADIRQLRGKSEQEGKSKCRQPAGHGKTVRWRLASARARREGS